MLAGDCQLQCPKGFKSSLLPASRSKVLLQGYLLLAIWGLQLQDNTGDLAHRVRILGAGYRKCNCRRRRHKKTHCFSRLWGSVSTLHKKQLNNSSRRGLGKLGKNLGAVLCPQRRDSKTASKLNPIPQRQAPTFKDAGPPQPHIQVPSSCKKPKLGPIYVLSGPM